MYAQNCCWFDCEMIICMCRGTPFQVQDRYRQTALLRDRDYEAGQTVSFILVLCIY